jgi:hypothetical protein
MQIATIDGITDGTGRTAMSARMKDVMEGLAHAIHIIRSNEGPSHTGGLSYHTGPSINVNGR